MPTEENNNLNNQNTRPYNVVSGIVIDSNNPVFRNNQNFINSDTPIVDSDVVSVDDEQYFISDARIYRDAITIQNKRNTVIFLACIDMFINFIKMMEGNTFYVVFILCAYYGVKGAREFNYKYVSIYTWYLCFVLITNLLMCINFYYMIETHKNEVFKVDNTTLVHIQSNPTNNIIIILSLLIQTYIYTYANDLKNALKRYQRSEVATIVGVM